MTWLTSVFNLSKFEGNAAVSPATNVASACLPILWISGAIFVATHKFSCFNNLPPHLVLRSLTVGHPSTTTSFWVSSRNFKSIHYMIVTPRTYRAKDKNWRENLTARSVFLYFSRFCIRKRRCWLEEQYRYISSFNFWLFPHFAVVSCRSFLILSSFPAKNSVFGYNKHCMKEFKVRINS